MASPMGLSTAGSRPDGNTRLLTTTNFLISVLPALRSLIIDYRQQKTSVSRERPCRHDTKHEDMGQVLIALFIIEKHVRNIQNLGQFESFDDGLSGIADAVCVFTGNKGPTGNTTKGGNHSDAGFLGVQEFLAASKDSDYPRERDTVTLESRSSEDWATFSEVLATLTDQIQHSDNDLMPGALAGGQLDLLPKTVQGSSDFLSETFEAMTCVCEPKSMREMRVRLGAYKMPKGSGVETATILTKESAAMTWAEIRFHRSLQPIVPQVQGHGEPQNGVRQHDSCICGYYQNWFRPQHWRLNIQLLGSRLAKHWIDQTRSAPIASLQHQIDLKVMASHQGPTMPAMAKMSLSVILAYSLLYLYGGPWSKGRWTRDHIIFFIDDNSKIPMRPFLKVPVSTQSNNGKEAALQEIHRYPELLEFAIMLLEINFGESLESILGMDENIQSLNDSWCAASEVFDQRKLDIEKPGLRSAIALCLKPDFGMSFADHEAPHHSELRWKLLKHVVEPLEQDLRYAFQDLISVDDLDEEASKKILIPFTRPKAQLVPEGRGDTDLRAGYTDCAAFDSSLPVSLAKLRPLPFPPLVGDSALFNNESRTAEGLSSALTDQWIQRFRDLVQSHISEDGGRRLKVAILDTGINYAHPEFCEEPRIKALKSWTDGKPGVDLSGHGTHIASTILSLTLNVDLYIGKVTETNILTNTDKIADAIRFACNEWDVDMLSLSFGFPRGVRAIHDSIDKAVARSKVVFAAASNDGSNTARAYPASHDRVVAVHSTDGHGNRSAFNPSLLQHDDNFCVLGEQLEGAWSDYGLRRMSGTSFAVPVGVSIASFMIGFISKNCHDHEKWLVPLVGYEGVRVIFRLLSERRDSGYDLVNPLSHFSAAGHSGAVLLEAVQAILDR